MANEQIRNGLNQLKESISFVPYFAWGYYKKNERKY